MLYIREETLVDHAIIRKIHRLAFRGNSEAALVDRLRADGAVLASLVAIENGQAAGHILFSELPIDTDHGLLAAGSLAPVAVLPARQRTGIGSALVREGLEVCRRRGKSVAVVLGHPEYYRRFGFSPELAERLHGPYSGRAWMALELTPGALNGITGTVRYPGAFQELDS